MQRTHRQRRAAERDAGSHGIRLSRGLRRVQCRQRGHGKPRARLRRAGVAAVPLASARTSRLGATREGDAQGRPGIEPARPWPVRRGKCCALHITGCSAKYGHSLASSLGVRTAPPAAPRPAGSRNPRYVWRPSAPAARHRVAVPLQILLARSRCRASAAHRGKTHEPPPARRVAFARLRPCGPVLRARCATPPVRPRKRGLPEGQRPTPEPWGELPPLAHGG